MGHPGECRALLEALRAHYVVYRFAFSGHAGNPPDEPWSLDALVEDLQRFITANELENPAILGYSLGGYVALRALVNDRIACSQLFTIGTKWHWDAAVSDGEIAKLDADRIAEKAPQVAALWETVHAPADWKVMLAYARRFVETMPGEGFSSKQLREVSMPVHIAVGDADRFVTRDESEAIARQLPNAHFAFIADTPHPIERLNIEAYFRAIGLPLPV